jgi:lactose/L-arabinose transport system permease protein
MKKCRYPWGKILFLLLVSFLSVFPFYWMIVSSTNTSEQIIMGKLSFGTALHANIRNAFSYADLWTPLLNSSLVAISVTFLAIMICGMAGYAFLVYPSKARNFLFTFLIASMMVPFAARIIPMFRLFTKMHLVNSLWGIILPAVGTPFVIFFFRQNSVSFPLDLVSAARIDGLSEFGIFFKIYTPVMRPTYAAAAIFVFMATWNNYLWPLIILQDSQKYTLPLSVSNLASGFTPDYGMMMIGILVSTIPTIIIFFALQKSFVEGIIGSVKG